MTDIAIDTLDIFVRESKLWHKHFGYIEKRSLNVLSEMNLLCSYVTGKLNWYKLLKQTAEGTVWYEAKEIMEILEFIHLEFASCCCFF